MILNEKDENVILEEEYKKIMKENLFKHNLTFLQYNFGFSRKNPNIDNMYSEIIFHDKELDLFLVLSITIRYHINSNKVFILVRTPFRNETMNIMNSTEKAKAKKLIKNQKSKSSYKFSNYFVNYFIEEFFDNLFSKNKLTFLLNKQKSDINIDMTGIFNIKNKFLTLEGEKIK